jgi:hypothetical protein
VASLVDSQYQTKYHVPAERDLALTPFVPEVEDSAHPTATPCFGEITLTKLTSLIAEM